MVYIANGLHANGLLANDLLPKGLLAKTFVSIILKTAVKHLLCVLFCSVNGNSLEKGGRGCIRGVVFSHLNTSETTVNYDTTQNKTHK